MGIVPDRGIFLPIFFQPMLNQFDKQEFVLENPLRRKGFWRKWCMGLSLLKGSQGIYVNVLSFIEQPLLQCLQLPDFFILQLNCKEDIMKQFFSAGFSEATLLSPLRWNPFRDCWKIFLPLEKFPLSFSPDKCHGGIQRAIAHPCWYEHA